MLLQTPFMSTVTYFAVMYTEPYYPLAKTKQMSRAPGLKRGAAKPRDTRDRRVTEVPKRN